MIDDKNMRGGIAWSMIPMFDKGVRLYINLRCPVNLSRAFSGAGPIASTVLESGATCVWPASQTK